MKRDDQLLTIDQAAAVFQVERKWIERRLKALGARKLSRRVVRIPLSSLERFVEDAPVAAHRRRVVKVREWGSRPRIAKAELLGRFHEIAAAAKGDA